MSHFLLYHYFLNLIVHFASVVLSEIHPYCYKKLLGISFAQTPDL